MCRPAPRRLKWFTAGYITTVIRDRRIYNFLSLNTSLRIIFFYDCAVRTVFHGFGLFTAFSAGRVVFVCRPCDEAVTAISTGPAWRCSSLLWVRVQERIRTVVLQCLTQGHWGEPKSVTGRKMEWSRSSFTFRCRMTCERNQNNFGWSQKTQTGLWVMYTTHTDSLQLPKS